MWHLHISVNIWMNGWMSKWTSECMEMWSSSYTRLSNRLQPVFCRAISGVAVHCGDLEMSTLLSVHTAPLLFISNIGIPPRIPLRKMFWLLKECFKNHCPRPYPSCQLSVTLSHLLFPFSFLTETSTELMPGKALKIEAPVFLPFPPFPSLPIPP